MDKEKIERILLEAVIYRPAGGDVDILIGGTDTYDGILYGTSEDGNEYQIPFDEIDLELDSFFKYVKVDVDTI